MTATTARCALATTACKRPPVAQGRPSQCLTSHRIWYEAQCAKMQARHQNGAARRGFRLCAAALDTAGSIPTSLGDDPFLFEVEPSKAEDPRGGKTLAVALAKLAWETKSESVRVLHVAKQSSICSYMVIATVFSRPQLNAVLGKIERAAAEEWGRKFTPTGGRSSWEMLDLGDVIVNVMSEDARLYYDLEGLYAQGTPVDLPFTRQKPAGVSQDGPSGVQQWSTTL